MSPIYTLHDRFRRLPVTDFDRLPLPDGGLCMKRILSLLACIATLGVPAFAADTPQLQTRDARYHLHTGDVLGITYRYSPEYDATASIQPDGYADFPMLGELKLSGLTVDQARESILAKANTRLNDPEISVILKEFEKPFYIVGGEVGAPGRFEIRGPLTALRAVEIAGGIRETGKANQVLLIHPINETDATTRLINLKKVMKKGDISEDAAIQPGDIIIVPKTKLAKVEPYVKLANPGSYGLYVNPTSF
jgi:polysaccharide export outer membrane protein